MEHALHAIEEVAMWIGISALRIVTVLTFKRDLI